MPAASCVPNDWSIVTSASANSQLAGVLAGFVFTGFVILFSREGPKNAQTLSLFVISFLVLAFDSYLFGYVTGNGDERVCARVWTVGMVASGMLAAGAIALICGIAWLVVDYLDTAIGEYDHAFLRRGGRAQKMQYLSLLATMLPVCVQLPATLLLTSTMIIFCLVVVPPGASLSYAWLWITNLTPVMAGILVVIIRVLRRRKMRREAPADSGRHEITELGRGYLLAVGGLLAYATVGPIIAGAVTYIPGEWWSDYWWAVAGIVLAIGLIVPTVLATALTSVIPDISSNAYRKLRTARESQSMSEETASVEVHSTPTSVNVVGPRGKHSSEITARLVKPGWLKGLVVVKVIAQSASANGRPESFEPDEVGRDVAR